MNKYLFNITLTHMYMYHFMSPLVLSRFLPYKFVMTTKSLVKTKYKGE